MLRHGAISLGIDPRRPETVYAGATTPGTSILKTIDGGGSWRATGPPGLVDNYYGHPIVVDRRAPGIVYAGGSRGLFASRNKGRTWSKLLPLREAFSGVNAIALDPVHANVLYVGTTRGLVKSDDGGQTWSALRVAGRNVSSLAIAPTNPPRRAIYAGVQWKTTPQTWAKAMFASTDDGRRMWHRLF